VRNHLLRDNVMGRSLGLISRKSDLEDMLWNENLRRQVSVSQAGSCYCVEALYDGYLTFAFKDLYLQ
jgi:hypothetical protein